MKLTKEEERLVTRIMDKDAVDNGLSINHVIEAYRLGKKAQQRSTKRIAQRTAKAWIRPSKI